uniref:SANTA domain-containing protein n=1 Tax=Ditylenchus dipsaci TaxID=166011 RepID=A0A915ES63_9BILA
MPYLYLSSFDTSRHDDELMKTESVLEHSTASNHYETFSQERTKMDKKPSLVNSQPDKKQTEEPVSLVRWSLVLTALNPSNNSGLFGVSVHGIRIDTGMDFASAEILQVEDGRTVVTGKGTLKLVGPINTESVKKSRLKCFEAGLPLDWRSIVVEQYMDGCIAAATQ